MGERNYQRGDELVPGYDLTSYLGRGGFGQVWQATGPGGVQVAIKIIHDLDRKKGGRELKALRLLKDIRHPNLVPLLGFWLRTADDRLLTDETDFDLENASSSSVDAENSRGTLVPDAQPLATLGESKEAVELIIAMGLCEQSLIDRLEQCKADGQRALPFDELLTYMEDTARAIDLLNNTHDIQHCDIKPQNMLLLSDAAQVADFGLAKMIGDVRESSMGAGTIAYGAPEVLLGAGPSHTTDQYSLAITYFELRTGELPFGSDRISEVLGAKQDGTIDLGLLPEKEREIIAKATSIKPDARFASCVEMVHAIRDAGEAALPDRPAGDTKNRRSDYTVPMGRQAGSGRRVYAAIWSVAGLLLLAVAGIVLLPGALPQTEQDQAVAQGAAQENGLATEGNVGEASSAPEDVTPTETPASADVAANEAGDIEVAPKDPAPLLGHESEVSPSDVVSDIPSESQVPEVVEEIVEAVEATADNTREIAEATEETAANTRTIVENTERAAVSGEQLVEAAEKISRTLDDIREQLAEAADQDGLIGDPREPSDFYHNARMYEQRGDYRNARRNYARLLAFKLDVVDPHLEYQRIIRIQDGRSAAKEVYSELPMPDGNRATPFARALVENEIARRDGIAAFVDEHPEYAPAVYYLSLEYSKDKLGAQGLDDMAKEKRLLEQFQELVDEGELLKHFLDQSHAIKMIDDAQQRLQALKQFDATAFENPIRVTAMPSNSSWTVNLAISEVAREISYRLAEVEPFQKTGFNSFVDQRTGSPSPQTSFQLPLKAKRTTFWVKYLDIRGSERGPFELVFDPDQERLRFGKQILNQLPNAWVSFRPYDGRVLAYFTHLQAYRDSLKEIRYSVDTESLDQVFPIGRQDPENLNAIRADTQTHIDVPHATRFVVVQLTFRDGTKSKLQRFERKPTEQPLVNQYQQGAVVPHNQQQNVPQGNASGTGRLLERVDVNVDPSFRRAPRVRFGFGF